MNFIQRFKNLKYYAKILDENKQELYDKHNIKIDNVYRMYTIYKIDPKDYDLYGGDKPIIHKNETIKEALSGVSKTGAMINGEDYFNSIIQRELAKLDQFLISRGLSEMYGMTSKKRIDKFNSHVIIEFKYLNTVLLANMALILGITILSSTIIGFILLLFLKIF